MFLSFYDSGNIYNINKNNYINYDYNIKDIRLYYYNIILLDRIFDI